MSLDPPHLFTITDEASLNGQKKFIRATSIQLSLLLVAGAASAVTWSVGRANLAALIAGVAFVIAALLRLDQLTGSPGRVWYEGRAAAESLKTLSWLYAVGGLPFPTSMEESQARRSFEEQAAEMVSELQSLPWPATADSTSATTSMIALREAPLDIRRNAFREGRLLDQQHWYAAKAQYNDRRAKLWSRLVLVFEVCGAVGAFLNGFGVVDIDILGLAGAAAATAAAWMETKQHQNLANAYRVAAQELESILSLVDEQDTEERWARFASDSEQAISREHTLWRARAARS